jgi:hypothetical protein
MASLRTLHAVLTHHDVAPLIDALVDGPTPPMTLRLDVGTPRLLHVTFPPLPSGNPADLRRALAEAAYAAERRSGTLLGLTPANIDEQQFTAQAAWQALEPAASAPAAPQGPVYWLGLRVGRVLDGMGPLEVDAATADGAALDSDAVEVRARFYSQDNNNFWAAADDGLSCAVPLQRVRRVAAYDGRQHWRLTFAFPSMLPICALYICGLRLGVRVRDGEAGAALRPHLKAARVAVLRLSDALAEVLQRSSYEWHSGTHVYRVQHGGMRPKVPLVGGGGGSP